MTDADGMPIHYIDTDQELATLCEEWRRLPALALDTEFIRTNTFYARLGLIQVGDGRACYLIDPLEIEAWGPFKALLQDDSVEIVLHSASEDLNLLFTSFGCTPARMFDTQVAAGFLGLGFSLSYQALVADVLQIEVAKGETRSDWLQRPLTDSQLLYAALDVRYLPSLRDLLRDRLVDEGKLDWFEEECALRCSEAAAFESLEGWARQYTAFANAWRLNDRALVYLQRLCLWREREARRRDRPKSWIAKDNELQAIAQFCARAEPPLDTASLKQLNEVNQKLIRYRGGAMLAAMENEEDLSPPDRGHLAAPLEPHQRRLLKQCQKSVQARAETLGMAPELLATKRQLVELLLGVEQGEGPRWNKQLAGWRRQLLEEDLSEIVRDKGGDG